MSVEYGPDTTYGFSTSQQRIDPVGLASIEVAGMRANTTYHMRAHLQFDDGAQATDTDHTFTTGSIPAGFRSGANTYRAFRIPSLYPGVQW